jgi:uncharacterized protein YdaU (DUF1376 family)
VANFDHWMRLNIGDYLADTMHLNTLQHGMYVLLIMHYFKRGPLPDDRRTLAGIARVSPRAWARDAPAILAMFSREGGRLRHKRIDAERAEAERLSSRRHAKRDEKLARTPGTTAKATNPPHNPPVIDLHSRRKKNGGWTDAAIDLASGDDE